MRSRGPSVFVVFDSRLVLSATLLVFACTAVWSFTAELEAKLLPSDGTSGDHFGGRVAIDGDTAVIAAISDGDNGEASGSAYVFTRTGQTWSQQAKLLPSDGAPGDWFGYSVAVDGDTAIICALLDDDNGTDSGSAYVFNRTGGVWTQQSKLLPLDGADYDKFGDSVAIAGDTAIIGAREDNDNGFDSGSAYVFVRSGTVWTQQAKLLPSDGEAYDMFGDSVAHEGDTAIIGARGDDDIDFYSGAAYVFTRTGSSWTEQVKLTASDASRDAYFGVSVALDGESALVGAPADEHRAGSAYVFIHTGGLWTEQAKLTASDGPVGATDDFGYGVALVGDAALVGAQEDDHAGPATGSAYLFARQGGVWTEQAKLLEPQGEAGDRIGRSVVLDGDTAIVGASGDDDAVANGGAAYVLRLYDGDVPATSVIGILFLLLFMAGTCIHFAHRRAGT